MFEKGEKKGTIKKVMTYLLILSMCFGMLPPAVAKAEEVPVAQTEGMDTVPNPENQQEGGAEAAPNTVSTVDAVTVNYIYVEKPYVQTPDVQSVVVSLPQESIVESAQLKCVNESTGEVVISDASGIAEGAVQFTMEYSSESQSGIYVVSEFTATVNGVPEAIIFSEIGAVSRFGVNQECVTTPDVKVYESEAEAELPEVGDAAEVGLSVASFDENGSVVDGQSIESAIETTTEEVSAMFSAAYTTRSGMSGRSSGGKMVVVLDPGHCGSSHNSGATGHGYREEERVLKIAQYCKAELDKNPNLLVYMTRNQVNCPFGVSSLGDCLAARTNYAKSVGADIFVSFHLNASTSPSENGAEVIVPNKNGNATVGNNGTQLGQLIQNQLVALGLYNRGVYSKDTTLGEVYDDGKLQDYFQVQNTCKQMGIPGIIVEHAFLSNGGNVSNFLNTESGLRSLGIADANGITAYYNSHKSDFGKWVKRPGLDRGWWYQYGNGDYPRNCWKEIEGSWYHFDADGFTNTGWFKENIATYYLIGEKGAMVTGWQWIDSTWYYFDSIGFMQTGLINDGGTKYYMGTDGKIKTGWQWLNNTWYYFQINGGAMVTGLINDGGTKYYLGTDGKIKTGWQWLNNTWYYFKPNGGAMVTGWVNDGETKYYLNADGKIKTGWHWDSGLVAWYYFTPNGGAMATGWVWDGSAWYYLNQDGKIKTGWHWDAGYDGWYYFYPNKGGSMAFNTTIDGYYVDGSGKRTGGQQGGAESGTDKTKWQNVDGKWYYYNTDGTVKKGWHWDTERKAWYYFAPSNGAMVTGWVNDGGTKYYMGTDGKIQTGWQWIGNTWYYFIINGGAMATGWVNDGGTKYYMGTDGKIQTGWQWIGDTWYYFNPNGGAMATGWVNDGGTKYYMEINGRIKTGWHLDNVYKVWYYLYPNGGAMAVKTWIDNYYVNENGIWTWTGFNDVMGSTKVSLERMVKYYNSQCAGSKWAYPGSALGKNKDGKSNSDSAANITEFCQMLIEEANAEGVRAEVVFAQIMLETKYLQFGGDVKVNQYNFGGIGATGGGVPGNSFQSTREGLRVNVQHLKAYASTAGLNKPCVDPRFQYVSRGCAQYVEWLGIQENPSKKGWAASAEYGFNLMKLIQAL